MDVAVVLTVKNEARLLKQNIYYHLGIGIKKIFIYFDGTEDGGRELVQDIEDVECLDSIVTNKYDNLPFLKKFTDSKLKQHTARQCLNSYDAEQRCIREGIDWLISIDADEFFIPSIEDGTNVSQFFNHAEFQGYEIIRLGVFEVIPRKMEYANVVLEETLFKTKKNFKSKFDQIYFKITNPYIDSKIITHFWLSHNMGKCAIKVGKKLIPHNVHKYRAIKESGSVKTMNRGHILHYFQYDALDFIKKSKNFKLHPEYYLSGKRIGKLKALYIKLVNDPNMSEEELFDFYRENLLFDKFKMKRLNKTRAFNILPRREKAVIEIKKPKMILEAFKDKL
ncbi:glycosyltransferase family 2 protein [Bizionia sp.]|uniref:glycosyltransferase family 2 protein n=1 Tax=Bizionia sp. TaxID=1954480 RepID=UPI003A9243ED